MLTHLMNRKKQQSKKGVILVTVMFVFVIATIFIMCAITMTANTRNRLYDKTEKNQARLTVTSVAEAFYQALYSQNITDDQLINVLADSGSHEVVVQDGASIPGLMGKHADAEGNGYNSYTTYTVTKSVGDTYIVEFTTHIGSFSDSIRMTLGVGASSKPQPAFESVIETSGAFNMSSLQIGLSAPATATDNTVLVRGDWDANKGGGASDAAAASDFIFLKKCKPYDIYNFTGDLVLWGPSAYLDVTSVNDAWRASNVYAVNVNTTNDFRTYDDPAYAHNIITYSDSKIANIGNWGLLNTQLNIDGKTANALVGFEGGMTINSNMSFFSAQFDSNSFVTTVNNVSTLQPVAATAVMANADNYVVLNNNNGDGRYQDCLRNYRDNTLQNAVVASANATSDMQRYTSADFVNQVLGRTTNDKGELVYKYPSENDFPLASDALTNIMGISTYSSSTAEPITAQALKSLATGTHYLTNSASYVNKGFVISGGNVKTDKSDAYIVVDLRDGGKVTEQVIFVTGDLTITDVRILVLQDNPSDFLKIVLENGADIRFGGVGIAAGIYSCSNRSIDDVDGVKQTGEGDDGVDFAVNNAEKPHAYIFGEGYSNVYLDQHSLVEAFIGLYEATNDDIDQTGSSTVVFCGGNSSSVKFLGRIMASHVQNMNGGSYVIPYCLGPDYQDTALEGLQTPNSSYSVTGWEYISA